MKSTIGRPAPNELSKSTRPTKARWLVVEGVAHRMPRRRGRSRRLFRRGTGMREAAQAVNAPVSDARAYEPTMHRLSPFTPSARSSGAAAARIIGSSESRSDLFGQGGRNTLEGSRRDSRLFSIAWANPLKHGRSTSKLRQGATFCLVLILKPPETTFKLALPKWTSTQRIIAPLDSKRMQSQRYQEV